MNSKKITNEQPVIQHPSRNRNQTPLQNSSVTLNLKESNLVKMKTFILILVVIIGLKLIAPTTAKSCAGYSGSRYSHCLPDNEYSYVSRYVEKVAIPPYTFASDATYDAFNDIKYGVRIHWGIYSIVDAWNGPEAGYESWPFQHYNSTFRMEYENLYKSWNPNKFNASNWMDFFEESGFRLWAFTAKHHEGFSMYNTSTIVSSCMNWETKQIGSCENGAKHYSIMETSFGRDVLKELVVASKPSMKVDIYFSHPDWHDADFRPYGSHPVQVPSSCSLLQTYPEGGTPECKSVADDLGKDLVIGPDPSQIEEDRFLTRHRNQLIELLSNYGKIDMVCLDIQLGPKVWSFVRDTLMELRKIQPNVMFRARGIGNYGDYYTPEAMVPGSPSNSDDPWFVIYPLGDPFSYDPVAANYKGPKWVIENLLDIVSKGGSFMVGIGPDATGEFHPVAIEQLKVAGKWIHINSEGIFGTQFRGNNIWKEDLVPVRYTRSKANFNTIFAYHYDWPGTDLILATVRGIPNETVISMLGVSDVSLEWTNQNDGLHISIPNWLQNPDARPCTFAYGFKLLNVKDN